jgi:hypothetical protein
MKDDGTAVELSAEGLGCMARTFGGGMFTELVMLAQKAKSESVKLGAIKEILERGYGRARHAEPPEQRPEPTIIIVEDTKNPCEAMPDPSAR